MNVPLENLRQWEKQQLIVLKSQADNHSETFLKRLLVRHRMESRRRDLAAEQTFHALMEQDNDELDELS